VTTFNHEECYFKRFGKERPDDIRPIEERIEEMERKEEQRRLRKQLRRQSETNAI
jgi:hypothetical protein